MIHASHKPSQSKDLTNTEAKKNFSKAESVVLSQKRQFSHCQRSPAIQFARRSVPTQPAPDSPTSQVVELMPLTV